MSSHSFAHPADGTRRSIRARRIGIHAARTLLGATLVALAAPLAQGQEPAARTMAGTVYTADEWGSSISEIDLATGAVAIHPVPVSLHNVQITADGTRLLAVGMPLADGHDHGDTGAGGHDDGETAGRLLILDAGDLSAPAGDVAVGRHPAHVIADPQGQFAFVTNAGDDSVTVIDLARQEAVGTIATGDYPHGLRMDPGGREIYLANVAEGSLSVIDVARLEEAARIPVGKAPVQVAFTPDGSRVYASLRDENRVVVVDTASRTVIDRIEVGRNPIQVHASPDGGYVYVANQGTETEPADTVSVIEVATGKVVDTIRTGRGAHGVAVSGDGAAVFITNIVDGTVSVIDTATRGVTATFVVGAGPNGVTFRPASTAVAEHDAHHPGQAAGAAAPDPATRSDSSSAAMADGMAGMMGMMTPEMMKMMQGMMAMQGAATDPSGMSRCPAADMVAAIGRAGTGPGALYGVPPASQEEMTPERVRVWLGQHLAWHGNPRLTIGEIVAVGEATVTAEILTIDGSLVQKLAFNRYPGLVRQVLE